MVQVFQIGIRKISSLDIESRIIGYMSLNPHDSNTIRMYHMHVDIFQVKS